MQKIATKIGAATLAVINSFRTGFGIGMSRATPPVLVPQAQTPAQATATPTPPDQPAVPTKIQWTDRAKRKIWLQVWIAFGLSIVFTILTGNIVLSFAFVYIVWTIVLCFGGAVGMWFIYVRANHAVVLEDPRIPQRKLSGDLELTRPQPTAALRVIIGPMVDGKSSYEKVLRVINLERSIPIGGKLEAITRDNVKIFIRKWKVFVSAIQNEEYLKNLARSNLEAIIDRITIESEAYITTAIKGYKVKELFENLYIDPVTKLPTNETQTRLREGFRHLFGGEDTLHPTEKRFGIYTNDPKIGEIELDPAYQKTLQANAMATEGVKGIKKYTRARVSPDIAANISASDRGIPMPARINKVSVEGLKKGQNFQFRLTDRGDDDEHGH